MNHRRGSRGVGIGNADGVASCRGGGRSRGRPSLPSSAAHSVSLIRCGTASGSLGEQPKQSNQKQQARCCSEHRRGKGVSRPGRRRVFGALTVGGSGSELVIEAGTAPTQRITNGRCHCGKRWRVRSSLKNSAQASKPDHGADHHLSLGARAPVAPFFGRSRGSALLWR